MRIMDSLVKGKKLSIVYLDITSRTYADYFVEVENPKKMATSSGFDGQRAIYDWKDRIKILEEYGFIKTAPGENGDISYIFVINPYLVIKNLRVEGKVPDLLYNALFARAEKIGAKEAKSVLSN
tara:strand:- start:181 stop:552 length:372 start_codon:yes stop_codon:yes gene_type:complete